MAKTRYIVQCIKHGHESKDWAGKQVVVPRPSTKNQRDNLGCPYCRAEAAAALRDSEQEAA